MRALPTSRPSRARHLALRGAAVAVALVLGAAGCSDDEGGNVVADVLEDEGLPTQPGPTTTVPRTCETAPEEVTEEDAPEVTVPEGEPPTELVVEDLVEGEGREVADGDSVQVHYTGVAFSTGTEFDTSWDDMTPLPVDVGAGGVIAGWEEGLLGMQVGGRRQLVIPPDLGYGEEGAGEDIGPDETLVFVVDLVEVCFPEAAPEGETTEPTEGEGTEPAEGEGTEPETTVPEDDGEGGGDTPTDPTDTE